MKSSNATASAFGWDFQRNTAIMLMLKNIESASKVKVEGQSEDVEITFSDGKKLMAQVKAVMNPDDFRNVKKKLEEGLRTLNTVSKLSNIDQLYFVTNSPNPFYNQKTMYKFSSPLNIVPFNELPSACQQVIKKIFYSEGYAFDTDLLKICVMHFHGENEDERYKVLIWLISEFLKNLGVNKVTTNELLTFWQHSFTINESQITKSITKEQMIWPMIALQCELSANDAAFEDYDENDINQILEKYKSVINNNSERFEFISSVLSDYNEFHPEMKSKERTKYFINEKWSNYMDSFDLRTADSFIIEMVVKFTIMKVLQNRTIITNIKRKVKL